MNSELKKYIQYCAYQLRLDSLAMTSRAGSGHITSCLSAADLVATIFCYAMQHDPYNFNDPDNDRFILSKGHAAPLLYAMYKEFGLITEHDLLQYRSINSPLEGHPTFRFAYAQAATGSLGMGLSIGAGFALSARMDTRDFYTYVLLGDGECAEGSVWEAAQLASYYRLNNLVAIVDVNRLGQTGQTMFGHDLKVYAEKFHAFGWNVHCISGHDIDHIARACDAARQPSDKPTVIIACTFKGYGTHAQDQNNFHGKAFEDPQSIAQELATMFAVQKPDYSWKPTRQSKDAIIPTTDAMCRQPTAVSNIDIKAPIATRKAYGMALVDLGAQCDALICLDADVKNSTYAELFEHAYPDRFVECFVAEQNMISMAVGMHRAGKIPFVSTFSAFFSRCFDQVRMAAISGAALRLVGSHAGVSIGQDGPSQMGLEDIALMQAIPASVVLYPSDAIATYRLVELMAAYGSGMSYLRTTRGATPILYNAQTVFTLGGSHVVRVHAKNRVCIVAAGITLHEALKAHDILQDMGIRVAVIDLYCIKPLGWQTIVEVALLSESRILTVEDHYVQGGIGQSISYALRNTDIEIESLAVTELPRSGRPDELLAVMHINGAAIVNKCLNMLIEIK